MQDDLSGKRLGEFELGAVLGHGGMGSVYRAQQPRMDRAVAIKVLPQYLSEAPGYRERFQREVVTMAKVEHPAILPIYHFGEEKNISYIVMRLLPGGSLADRLTPERWPSPRETLSIIEAVGAGLDHAHRHGVVHRDLKPANILFDGDGRPYLTDFGISKLMTSSVRITSEAVLVGTPAYMSPEQIRGEAVDGRADLYALGVMTYQVLAGTLPFTGDSPTAILYRALQEEPPQGPLAPPVYAVLRRMLAKQHADRFPSAEAFVVELRAALEQTGGLDSRGAGFAPAADRAHATVEISSPEQRGPDEGASPVAPEPALLDQIVTTREMPAAGFRVRTTIYSLDRGDRLGDYQLEDRLDEGERTRVFHALDLRHDRHVALKLIGTEGPRGTRAERFRREARLLGRLHHPRIVPILEFDSVDLVCFISMPFLTGRSLAHRLRQEERFALPFVVDIVEQLAEALDYLHTQSVLHRDLKPSNVVFDGARNAYLADLGIAKAVDDMESTGITRTGQIVGTPAYMAPEQWMGMQSSAAADQYSLGCIVYEMLVGAPPFAADAAYALMLQHVRDTPAAPSSVEKMLPAAVDSVMLRVLEKDPAQRYPDAAEFAAALRDALDGRAGEDAEPGSRPHVFISYARSDGAYAHRLADRMREAGLDVWIDARIEGGDRWWRTIVEAIDACAAFVVIMTPDSADSRWVEREILLADQRNKPAFPLLLSGDAFPLYINTQYMDVTGARLPPDTFYDRLAVRISRR
jgi:serine/threonine protein kinase